jgi:hypothetical protein
MLGCVERNQLTQQQERGHDDDDKLPSNLISPLSRRQH